MQALAEKLIRTRSLTPSEYAELLSSCDAETARILADTAVALKQSVYGDRIFLRGLIEISSFCKNDCLYCGIRRSNTNCSRYRLTADEIFSCAAEGYDLGFRTFVLQGGEDPYFTDERLIPVIEELKQRFPDAAVTLSLGERSDESYAALRAAGADRYLLRHETANPLHYGKLHPKEMSLQNRIRCLKTLKSLGYQTGCGFMVGSPYQTVETLAEDLKFIETFSPEMCGIGPFLPHRDTPFAAFPPGPADLTCLLLSVIRIIKPNILLPATTALKTLIPSGRIRGILSGANVIMPNLSPPEVREKYNLYDGKLSSGGESAQNLEEIRKELRSIGCRATCEIGNIAE